MMTDAQVPVLGRIGIRALENRKVSPETAVRHNVYTVRRVGDTADVVPDINGNVVAFPYFENGENVACKYRGPNKTFWQRPGGVRTFWNADVLDDPALHSGKNALVIVEGEIDALSVLESGYPFVVSVPDGAPAVPKGRSATDLEPIDAGSEGHGKFEFMWRNKEKLRKIKRFVIAVDSDAPGQRLAAELVRRLSAARCSFVAYPPDCVVPTDDSAWVGGKRPCKDLNDVLVHFGQACVAKVITEAKPYPVRGLYKLSDYPDSDVEAYVTGWPGWNGRLRVSLGEFMVITGAPSAGKSTWALHLVASLCSTHGWTAVFCAPEMPMVPYMRDVLRRWYLREKPVLGDPEKLARADSWIMRRFSFIDTDPTGIGDGDEPFDLGWVLERATDAVLRDGVKILVIDPWNELEHARDRGETETDYIARAIRAIKRWARMYDVMVIIVAHPTKEISEKGKIREPSLYEISGGANWYNKCDHGITVARDRATGITTISVKKVRFEGPLGSVGSMDVRYNRETGHFDDVEDGGDLAGYG